MAICEETCWVLPAHTNGVPEEDAACIDLFAAETGMMLAEIRYAPGDRLDAVVLDRIAAEVGRRAPPLLHRLLFAGILAGRPAGILSRDRLRGLNRLRWNVISSPKLTGGRAIGAAACSLYGGSRRLHHKKIPRPYNSRGIHTFQNMAPAVMVCRQLLKHRPLPTLSAPNSGSTGSSSSSSRSTAPPA